MTLYRGTSVAAANEEELGSGIIDGFTVHIHKGELRGETDSSAYSKGTPLSELPWYVPGDVEDKGYRTSETGVVGGITPNIATAIGFSTGIPLVFYLDDNVGSPMRVSYRYNWFNTTPAALPWVVGRDVTGEIRDVNDGLIGLTTTNDNGEPVVWKYGTEKMRRESMANSEESEWLMYNDAVDVSGSIQLAASHIQRSESARPILAQQTVYHNDNHMHPDAGSVNVDTMTEREAMLELHTVLESKMVSPPDNYWVVLLDTQLLSNFPEIPDDVSASGTDGEQYYESRAALPDYLFG